MPNKTTIPPPFDPALIHAPLTGTQREVILTYLDKFANDNDKNKDAFTMALVSGLDWTQFEQAPSGPVLLTAALKNYRVGKYDAQTVSVYKSFAAGAIQVPPGYQNDVSTVIKVPGVSSVLDFLKLLTDPNLWLRIVEVLLGALLLGVGVAKISTTTGAKIVNMTPIRKLT